MQNTHIFQHLNEKAIVLENITFFYARRVYLILC